MKRSYLLCAGFGALVSICTGFAGSVETQPAQGHWEFGLTGLAFLPSGGNLDYAVSVAGRQPVEQSWTYHSVDPSLSPGWDLVLGYRFAQSENSIVADWLHLQSADGDLYQVSDPTAIGANVQFVAPPYDVGPAVFAIKAARSTARFGLDDVGLNGRHRFTITPKFHVDLLYGAKFLRIVQTVKTTFSDNQGYPAIPGLTLPVPADPNWYFTTTNTSNFLGAGPDIGVDLNYQLGDGFGVRAKTTATAAIGRVTRQDDFNSRATDPISRELKYNNQFLSAPNSTRVVPGLDAQVGVNYTHTMNNDDSVTVELGYRGAAYVNSISSVQPSSLVQRGTTAVPEFVTGVMAINSTSITDSTFSFNGPYLTLDFNFAS